MLPNNYFKETRYPGRINIEVFLLNKKTKNHGARQVKNNKFNNYSSEVLKQEKEYLEKIGENKKIFVILDWKYHNYNSLKNFY